MPEPITGTGLAIYGGAQLLNGLLNLFGMNEQANENRRTRESNEKMFQTQLGFEKEKEAGNMMLGMKAQTLAEQQAKWGQRFKEKEFATETAANEEAKKFQRQGFLMNGFMSLINSGPDIRNQLINTWRA